MRRCCEAFGRRVGECIGRCKCSSGAVSAGQRLLPTALQFQYGGPPAPRVPDAKQIPVPLAPVGDLAPHGGGIAKITDELRTAIEALQNVQTRPLILTV